MRAQLAGCPRRRRHADAAADGRRPGPGRGGRDPAARRRRPQPDPPGQGRADLLRDADRHLARDADDGAVAVRARPARDDHDRGRARAARAIRTSCSGCSERSGYVERSSRDAVPGLGWRGADDGKPDDKTSIWKKEITFRRKPKSGEATTCRPSARPRSGRRRSPSAKPKAEQRPPRAALRSSRRSPSRWPTCCAAAEHPSSPSTCRRSPRRLRPAVTQSAAPQPSHPPRPHRRVRACPLGPSPCPCPRRSSAAASRRRSPEAASSPSPRPQADESPTSCLRSLPPSPRLAPQP